MNEEKRFILAAVARLIGYPDHRFPDERDEILLAIPEWPLGDDLRQGLSLALSQLCGNTVMELQELYVTTFDMKEDTGLYLTAMELGDSRDRGAALILLKNIVADAGFTPAYGELADYIPALYELLAVSNDNVHIKALERRLSVATKKIADYLPDGHPYKSCFSILVNDVFDEPTAEDIEKLTHTREAADIEDLPYPVLYGMDGMARGDISMPGMNFCKGMEV
ncbi:nitrate reductase delta subunit [Fontibacillus solani]|uniref:Nitrate reductase delta subunit n=1 Tax=Fontibacillus solani TaxID=1572857 RepID=A0A7W3XRL2_9BACL|nr:nitrate reductase molybdenum cofactor assembly chaperone [Fontibacillus solani]MBA9085596.1 nitrate reductase delta subunit [Fontibacillus solani]